MSQISEISEETMKEGQGREKKKTIGISPETYDELVKVGGYAETMDQIVKKCVEAYKREQEKARSRK